MRAMARPAAPPSENRILYEIISTVGSSLDLEQVLRAVVRLLSDASAVHALLRLPASRTDGERLVLRAASDALLATSSARSRSSAARASPGGRPSTRSLRSPRSRSPTRATKFVPELEEERFQSLLSRARSSREDGNVIGVISLHTEAPREFTDAEVEFLVSSASLVAGAIENARLYEETRRRVGELEHLTRARARRSPARQSARRAPARGRARGRRAAARRALPPLPARRRVRGAAPARLGAGRRRGARRRSAAELGPELARSGRSAGVAVPLVADDELLGLLIAKGTSRGRARARGRQPDRGRDQEDRADRAADREEPDQGLLRAARRRQRPAASWRAAPRGSAATSTQPLPRRSPPPRRRRARERARGGGARGSLFDRRDDSIRAPPPRPARAARQRSSSSCGAPRRARGAGLDRRLERLPGRRELPGRLRGGRSTRSSARRCSAASPAS